MYYVGFRVWICDAYISWRIANKRLEEWLGWVVFGLQCKGTVFFRNMQEMERFFYNYLP